MSFSRILILILFTCLVSTACSDARGATGQTTPGTFVTFDAPDAGTRLGQGTVPQGANSPGTIVGYWLDSSYGTLGGRHEAWTRTTLITASCLRQSDSGRGTRRGLKGGT